MFLESKVMFVNNADDRPASSACFSRVGSPAMDLNDDARKFQSRHQPHQFRPHPPSYNSMHDRSVSMVEAFEGEAGAGGGESRRVPGEEAQILGSCSSNSRARQKLE